MTLLTIPEFATQARVSVYSVRRWLQMGRIPADQVVRFSRRSIRIKQSALDGFTTQSQPVKRGLGRPPKVRKGG